MIECDAALKIALFGGIECEQRAKSAEIGSWCGDGEDREVFCCGSRMDTAQAVVDSIKPHDRQVAELQSRGPRSLRWLLQMPHIAGGIEPFRQGQACGEVLL